MSVTHGLVLRARSGFYTIETDEGDLVEARLRGRVKKDRQTSDLAVIGDRVEVERLDDGTGAIASVEPRERRFSRRQPGPRGTWREDVMVANPDLVAAVFACDRPPPNPRLRPGSQAPSALSRAATTAPTPTPSRTRSTRTRAASTRPTASPAPTPGGWLPPTPTSRTSP